MTVAPNGRVLSPGEVIEDDVPQPAQPQEWRQDLNVKLICHECREDPPNLVENFAAGDTVCGSCGMVLAEHLVDTRSEWRTFSNDDQGNDDPSRVGEAANPLLNGSQLQSNISYGDGGSRNRELQRAQNKATHDKSTKTLLTAYKQIGSLCDSWELPRTVSESAKHIFKLAEEGKILRGKSQEAIIAGCIFIACRQTPGSQRTFREIYNLTKVSKKEIGRVFKALEDYLRRHSQQEAKNAVTSGVKVTDSMGSTESVKPSDLCNRYCNKLNLSRQTTMIATNLATAMEEANVLAGRSPLSAAAACIYMVSYLMNEPRSPKEIAKHAGVSDGTIRTSYKYLYSAKDQLIDPEWLKRGGDMSRLPAA